MTQQYLFLILLKSNNEKKDVFFYKNPILSLLKCSIGRIQRWHCDVGNQNILISKELDGWFFFGLYFPHFDEMFRIKIDNF